MMRCNFKVQMFKSELHILCYYIYITQISVATEILQVAVLTSTYFISLVLNFVQMFIWRQGAGTEE